jgi:hypothetical protein
VRYLGERKGAVLIVVLGVLAVLALLATTFATLQATEKQVARNYLDTVRAKLLAQSGVQDAEARLRDYFPFRYFDTVNLNAPRPWKYWGADRTETVEPSAKDRLEDALNPSFAIEANAGNSLEIPQNPTDPNVNPKTVRIEMRDKGISGIHGSGTYAVHGDHYALKVSDISGRIYVNDGLDGGPQGSVSQNLKRILNILGEIVQVPQLGDRILQSRPLTGYRNMQDLLKAVGFDETLFARFREYVTVYAWIDHNVANPVPLSIGKLGDYPVKYYRGNPPVYRHGSMVSGRDAKGDDVVPPGGLNTCPQVCASGLHDNPSIRLYGHDSLNPQFIEIVSRAPVNVNAASREVLVALLTDLRGFFLADRRRNNPRWKGDLYISFKQINTLSPDRTEGDEIGFLMETVPIVGPGGTATDGISAFAIADEIIACRNRKASPNFNYSTVPWGGPFKTWRQFYQFVDNLALSKAEGGAGVIDDTRPIHKDYEEEIDDPSGFGALVPSEVQRRHAIKAIADGLKANFNPNLILNETNPDENKFLRVDKTDLIVNSTEFCFMPTGYFEIESLGRVVRPKDAQMTDAYLGDNELVAQAKVTATYKLYDLYRETSQKHFYAGQLPPKTGAFETNNDLSLEIGPEPDNGIFPGNLNAPGEADNEWGGYVALPTMGGLFGGHGANRKQPNTMVSTLDVSDAPHLNAAMHAHFTLDCHAHHSIVDKHEIGHWNYADDPVENFASKVAGSLVPYGRPYAPSSGPGDRVPSNNIAIHRMARSFRQTVNPGTGTVTSPSLMPYAPSDLRIDGCQTERHCAPSYYVQKGGANIWNFAQTTGVNSSGLISYWFKPSFFPDLTGKVRIIWDLSRYHDSCGQRVNVWPFAQWYFPSNYQTGPGGVSENTGPKYWHNNMGQFQPSSLVWGSKQWHSSTYGEINGNKQLYAHEFGKLSICLNHLGHDDCVKLNRVNPTTKPSPLRAHKWINTSFGWTFAGSKDSSGFALTRMYVNGVPSGPASRYIPYTYTSMTGGWGEGRDQIRYFDKHDGGDYVQMRLGASSRITPAADVPAGGYRGNHTSDDTIDEVYVWKAEGEGDPLVLWQRGRYYKPLSQAYGEGIFTSQAIQLSPSTGRMPAPPSAATAPTGSGGGGGATGGGQGGSIPVEPLQIRVLGLTWTYFGEDVDPQTQMPALYDYNSPLGIAADDVLPRVRVGLQDGAVKYGPFDDDFFSAVRDQAGNIPVMQDPKQIRYFAQFRLEKATLGTILLATPYLDDVTVFWDDTRTHLLSYTFDSRSF